MNQSQWKIIDAMGISSWQLKQPGEIAAPNRLGQQPSTGDVRYLIIVEKDDLFAHRPLLQSILNAVNWPVGSYCLLTDVEQLDKYPLAKEVLIWRLGAFELPESAIQSGAQLIEGPALSELASEPALKAELWAELKPHRCTN